MQKKIKKIFCVMLACATVMCMMPAMAFAESGSAISGPFKDAREYHETNSNVVTQVPVKTVSITGEQKTGATLTAVAKGENDAYATNVTYQWQQLITEEDDLGEEYTDWSDIKDATSSTFTVPDLKDSVGVSYRVIATGESSSTATSETFVIKTLSNKAKLNEDSDALTLNQSEKVTKTGMITLPTAGKSGSTITWTSSDMSMITAAGVIIALPETGTKEVTLTAALKLNDATTTKEFKFTLYSDAAQKDDAVLSSILEKYKWGAIEPEYGKDTNVKTFFEKDIKANGFDNIGVTIKSIEKVGSIPDGAAGLSENGDLTYFFADPLSVSGSPYYNQCYGNYTVTFVLSKGDVKSEITKQVHINWNADKLYEALKSELADNISWDLIKGENTSADSVTKTLALPRYYKDKNGDKKTLCEVTWTSSDPSVIAVEADKKDTIFGDYFGKINRDTTSKKVTLTATFDYKNADDSRTCEKQAITKLTKSFEVTVPALNDEEIKASMQKELDDNYTADKLSYIIGGNKIDTNAVDGDIQLLTGSKTGIKGYGKYKFTVTCDSTDDVEINGYRANIYRPLPGEKAKAVTLTVKMAQRSNANIYAEKKMTLKLKPLEQTEIDAAKAMMTKTVAAYFTGIKGENTDINSITKDLTSFQEATLDSKGNVKFIYNFKDTTGEGIVPVTYVEKTEAGGSDDQYTYFHSSKTALIQSGIPRLLGVPEYNTKVVVDSYLSSDIYGKYYTKYKKAGDTKSAAIFAGLYRQHASATVTVKGEKGENPNPIPEPGTETKEKIKVVFQLVGSDSAVWINSTTINADKDGKAGDVVKKVLTDNGYKIGGSMSYISSITTPAGVKLGQFDKGPNSGWLYSINGAMPSLTLDQYTLKNGDQIRLFYTNDYTKESSVTPTPTPTPEPGGGGSTTDDPDNNNTANVGQVNKVKVVKSHGKFVITWKKVSKVSGYQIKSKTSKNKKYANVKGLKKLSENKYKTQKYSKHKIYWFKVRAYKIVDGKKTYGAWSNVVKVKGMKTK